MVKILAICFIVFISNIQYATCQQTSYNCVGQRSQINTAENLLQLRTQMKNLGLYAYVILSEDEYMYEYDTRRAWITGFSRSIGSIVVTLDQATLWIDDRYRAQAENKLDCANWLLIRQDESGVSALADWVSSKLDVGSPYNKVGMAAQYTSSVSWSSMKNALTSHDVPLVEVAELIDQIRIMDRSRNLDNSIYVHDITFAGLSWKKKVEIIAGLINAQSAQGFVVTALDDIPWLFNLRGSDNQYTPYFTAYAFVHVNQTTRLWVDESRLTPEAKIQLADVIIQPYADFLSNLNTLANSSDMNKIWVTQSASQAILNRIPVNKRFIAGSPIERTKAVKNPIEQKGMRESSLRDSIARVRHLTWLENEIKNNRQVNETQAAEQLEYYQSQEAYFKGLSFQTISAVGAHAAVIHFEPDAETAAQITKDKVYLLDAGAQYLDGTTDITRTHTFGVPTVEEKKAYTLVLQGSIDLADTIFPVGTYGRQLDILARQSLYKNFMDYAHSTGHGIGHFNTIHEGPSFIGMGYSTRDILLTEGMVFSDEPGFYLPNSFGIRLETHIMVKNYTLPNNYMNSTTQFLHFEPHTFVPFDRNLIICEMLTQAQLNWLNWYHGEVRSILESTGRLNSDELNYLKETTQPLNC
ncbi:unnamed protein product [Adineta steineri]|uniref:Xaa-Pro aminopeptidase n=1 Tax=Adineta steineri TaxID=433720 RepID=A0A819PDM6_9BILA|nr:unnamed protein product [Adineta steineri]